MENDGSLQLQETEEIMTDDEYMSDDWLDGIPELSGTLPFL